MDSKNDLWNSFDAHFQSVVNDLTCSNDDVPEISTCYKRLKKVLEYNVPFGKRTRGLTVVSCYLSLKGANITTKEEKIAMSLGWAVEIMQACALVADDIMDQSKTRRGRLCWYLNDGVGDQAINDSMLLESCIFTLLRKHCKHLPCYTDLFHVFHETLLNAEIGQSLDMQTSERNEIDITLFTEKRYEAVVKYKTSYYSFYLPIAVALYLAGINDDKVHTKVCNILLQMGNLFQVQDDYLDVFGDPSITGKIGTDIEDNKCSWLIVKALALSSPSQIKILKENYGKHDSKNIEAVKQIFKELDLPTLFEKYGLDTYNKICTDIDNFDDTSLSKSVFFKLLNKIYKRVK